MAGLADELLKAFSLSGDGAALQLLQRRKSDLTVDVADELRARFKQAVGARDGDAAFATSMLASVVYLEVGKKHEALKSLLDNVQLRFMAANDAGAYEKVRMAALDCMSKAQQIDAGDIAFPAALTAADCSYFASGACGLSSNNGRQWLRRCLDDLEKAALLASGGAGNGWLTKLASLMAQATVDAQSVPWFDDQAAIEAQLRRLAAAAEQNIPPAFYFPDDPTKTKNIGRALANLSYRYGSADSADGRIDWLMKNLP